MTTPSHSPNQNRLLAALDPQAFERLAPALEWVPMRLGDLIYEPGVQLRHAYFPTTSVVSLHYITESGASAETAGVGFEGMVGVSLFMGGGTTSSSAVVQTAGQGYRIERGRLLSEFECGPATRATLLRYTQALITQMAQAVACYRHHSVEQQLSRWLLATTDRTPSNELVMTQELVASMLGVRRESITQAAGSLQDLGYIRYRRGHISVLDTDGLRTRACECYEVLRRELQRLQPPASA